MPHSENQHPVDRLADIRQQIADLNNEADAIRNGILAGSIGRKGEQHMAEVRQQSQRYTTVARAEKMLTPVLFEQFVQTRIATCIYLFKIDDNA